MTISQAINEIDKLQPNTYTAAEKTSWLSTLDQLVIEELHSLYLHDEEPEEFVPYTAPVDSSADNDTELLIPEPYSYDVYINYLASRIDFWNNEIARYNNSNALYNAAMSTYINHYNRTNIHKRENFKYF